MPSVLEFLRSASPQYKLGDFSKAFSPFSDIVEKKADLNQKKREKAEQLQQKDRQRELERELYAQERINPLLADIEDPTLRREFIKNSFKDNNKPETWAQTVGRYWEGSKPQQNGSGQLVYDRNQQPVGFKTGNKIIPVNDLSPQTVQNLQMLNEDNQQQPQQTSSLLQQLGQFGTGALTQLAGMPGDTLQFGANVLGKLGSITGLGGGPELQPEQREFSIKYWQDKLKNIQPGTPAYSQAQEILGNLQQGEQPVKFPTTEVIKNEGVPALTKDTALEPYTIPQNEWDEKLQELGGITALLTNPTKSVPTLLKNILKGAGVAFGGDFAGWLTKNATGSESLGDVIKNGMYLGYSLFPGMAHNLSEQGYKKYADKVITPALQEGKVVSMAPYKKEFQQINNKIDKRFTHTSEAYEFLSNEAAKVEELMGYQAQINPDALWNNIEEMASYAHKAPEQSQGVFQELIDMQKKALSNFSDTITPDGGKILENAHDLLRTAAKIKDDFSFIKEVSNPRNYGAGALFLLGGGYSNLIKAGLGAVSVKTLTRMLSSPAYRSILTQLAKASAAQNATLTNKLLKSLDKETDKALSKLPAADQQKVRVALEQNRSQE